MVARQMLPLASGAVAALGLLLGQGAEAVTILAAQRVSGRLALGSAELRAAQDAEAEDTRFWASQWSSLESELLRFRAAAAPQAAAKPAAPTAPKAAANAGATPKAAAAPQVGTVAAAAAAPAAKVHEKSPLAGLKLNLNPKAPSDLLPTLAMLKGLYEDGKERIAKVNAREQDSKKKFEEKQKQHQKRLDEIEARFKNHTLSEGFRTNETHDENRMWKYWERVRERQHGQFHTSLKIQHATLDKVKTMIDMYEKTISGTADKSQVAKQLAKVGGGVLPDVVFLQSARLQDVQQAAVKFCDEALKEVRSQEAALLQIGSQAQRSQV